MIHIENLTFEYPPEEEGGTAVRALQGIDLDIQAGSFTAILGRNGSGKSTLSKQLNALLTPLQGDVYVCGMNTRRHDLIWEIRRSAGMVFQNPDNQLISAIVEDDVAFGLENLGVPPEEIRRRIDEAMKKTGIYHLRKKSPHMLSGGQKQRVAIAGAAAMHPRCIIFDEPTAMLDPKGRQEVMEIIHSLRDDGVTVILITHFMGEAVEADRVIIMEEGGIVMDGSPREIFEDAERLYKIGLDLPAAADIRYRLCRKGFSIPSEVLSVHKLSSFLCERWRQAGEMTDQMRDSICGKMDRTADVYEKKRTADFAAAGGKAAAVAKSCEKDSEDREVCGDCGNGEEILDRDEAIALSVEHISHVYSKGQPDETCALRDVSFEIKQGEFIGVIGHTGSGKSTLIQHLNGLLKPDSGRIIVNGYDITAKNAVLRDIRKKVGLVFQYPEYQLFEETTAKDVAYGPKNIGLNPEEIEIRVREAMELVGLPYEKFADRSPFELSGGQKRRAAIAGVLAMHPEVLILDEPTAGLDPKTHQDILDMICGIREKRGMTVILVSHNMNDVARLCDRIFVMDQGSLVKTGTPRRVFSDAELLKDIGLGLPEAAELLYEMKAGGVPIRETVMTAQEAADVIECCFRTYFCKDKDTSAKHIDVREQEGKEC